VVCRYEERVKGRGGQAHQRTMRLPIEQFIGRWRYAGNRWAKGRSRHPHHGTGRTRVRQGMRYVQRPVRSEGSGWCARPCSPAPESHHPLRRIGSRWHERANGRGRPEANPPGSGVPCRGTLACSLAPRLPRRLPILVPTAPRAGDLRRERERFQVGIAIPAP
jgi:hypothetical protein